MHTAVLVDEVLDSLDPRPGDTIVDCTIGAAGHSGKILEKIAPGGRLIGIDADKDILEIAEKQLSDFKGNFVLENANFRDVDKILDRLNIQGVDGLLFDLGVSSYQLGLKERGFSFNLEGPLDMRMGAVIGKDTAYELVNFTNEEDLANIIFEYGQERHSRRIADAIARERKIKPVSTTKQLAEIILKAMPKNKSWQKIHPATRTFQALRIAVNDELGALKEGLAKSVKLVKPGGRICVISFHSLEDRIVKNFFKDSERQSIIKTLTKKPVCPKQEEIKQNPRSRSAKLRAAEKLRQGEGT